MRLLPEPGFARTRSAVRFIPHSPSRIIVRISEMTHIQVSRYRKIFSFQWWIIVGISKLEAATSKIFVWLIALNIQSPQYQGEERAVRIFDHFVRIETFWFMLENLDFMEVTVKFGLFCHPMEIRSSAPDLHYIIKRPTMINFDHQILANGWSDDKRRWRRRCIISFNSQMSRAASVTMKALLPLENSIKCKTIYIH